LHGQVFPKILFFFFCIFYHKKKKKTNISYVLVLNKNNIPTIKKSKKIFLFDISIGIKILLCYVLNKKNCIFIFRFNNKFIKFIKTFLVNRLFEPTYQKNKRKIHVFLNIKIMIKILNFLFFFYMSNTRLVKKKQLNYLDGGLVIRVLDQEVCSLCDLRFKPCGCSYDGHWRLTWSLTSGTMGLVEVHANWPGHPR
jgi:hypothetical protein